MSTSAAACPHCGKPTQAGQDAPEPISQTQAKSKPGCAKSGCLIVSVISVGLIVVTCIGSILAPSKSTKSSAVKSSPAPNAASLSATPVVLLEVGSWTWREEYSYATAEGVVTNISDRSLENVAAQVSFLKGDGTFITSDDALIEYNPLLPGQSSPWKVMATWNPEMASARVEFKHLFGGTIPTQKKK